MDVSRFESIGDNCEFGAVKRTLGDESGGLLRWVGSPPTALIPALRSRFAGLYQFENLSVISRDLSPIGDSKVYDASYGFRFHSLMTSKVINGVREWDATEDVRREIHKTEFEKSSYLIDKFVKRVNNPDVYCIYKVKDNLSEETAVELAAALATIGPARLVVVRTTKRKELIGNVYDRDKYLSAYIDYFAHYDRSYASSPVWFDIIDTLNGRNSTFPTEPPMGRLESALSGAAELLRSSRLNFLGKN